MSLQAKIDSGRRFGGVASGTIREYRFVAMKSDGSAVIEATGDRDEIIIGVSDREYATGALVSLQAGPIVRVKADAALDKTDMADYLLTPSSDGQAAAWSANAGKRLVAVWLPDSGSAALAADNPITAILLPNNRPEPLKGTVTIALGAGSGTAAVGADYNGKTVLCSPTGGIDDTAFAFSGAVAGGTLTITANANATAATDVAYLILD